MSDTVYQVGYIAVLDNSFVNEEIIKKFDEDYDYFDDKGLYLNYKKDLVYYVYKHGYIYDLEGIITYNTNNNSEQEFLKILCENGLKISNSHKIKFFVNVYYNGCDNPINLESIESFDKL